MERSVIRVNASDSIATLRCMLYGYLPSGQEPSIMWRLDGITLSNTSVYTITNEDGDMLIQNGGPQPIPSLTSTLTVNLTLSSVTGFQKYNCFFLNTSEDILFVPGKYTAKCVGYVLDLNILLCIQKL